MAIATKVMTNEAPLVCGSSRREHSILSSKGYESHRSWSPRRKRGWRVSEAMASDRHGGLSLHRTWAARLAALPKRQAGQSR